MEDGDRAIASFTSLAHGLFHTYELSIPIFIVVWLDVFSVTPATLGLVVSVGYGLIGVGALPSGILADRFGSRRLIVGSAVGMGAGFSLLALAPNVFTLGAAIVVWGAAASIYHPAGLSLISRGARERGTVFAYHGAGGNVGTAFGPLLAALLLVVFDWRIVCLLLILPAAAVVLLGSTIEFEEGATAADNGGSLDPRSILVETRSLFTLGFLVVFVIVMLYGTYYRGLLTFLPDVIGDLPRFDAVTVYGRPVEPAQYVYTGLLVIGIAGQYAGGRVTDLVETEHALLAVFVALAVLAFAFVPSATLGVAPFLLVCLAIGFALYATAPIYQVLIAEYAASDVHGLSYGYTYLGMFGVGAAGAAIAGTLLTYFASSVLFATLGVIAILAAALVAAIVRLGDGDRRGNGE